MCLSFWNGWVSAVCGRGAHPGESRVVGHAETKGLRYQVEAGCGNAAGQPPPGGAVRRPRHPGVARIPGAGRAEESGCMTDTTSTRTVDPAAEQAAALQQTTVPENPYAVPAPAAPAASAS